MNRRLRLVVLAALMGLVGGCSSGYREYSYSDNISYRSGQADEVAALQAELRERAATILAEISPQVMPTFPDDDADWVFSFGRFEFTDSHPLRTSSSMWIESGRDYEDHHVVARQALACIAPGSEGEPGSVVVGIELEYRGPERSDLELAERGLREIRTAFFQAMAGELDRLARQRNLAFELRDWGETAPPILPARVGAGM